MTKSCFKRRGFTLISMLIVIAITGILAAMMFMSSSEAIATARATAIIANLNTLKKAVTQWYIDNREKVQPEGTVKIGNDTKPIQEWKDSDIHLSDYLSASGTSGIQLAVKGGTDSHTGLVNTNLQEGCYGICDGGTFKEDNNGTLELTEYHRNAWYVGYRFTKDEANARESIKGRMENAGVFLGTADAHKDIVNDNSVAVWMRVF